MEKQRDSAGVWFPPPFIFIGFVLIGLGVEPWLKLGGFGLPELLRVPAGMILLIAGVVIELMASVTFSRAKTGLPPWTPSTSLVESGLHAVSRNPIYVGFAITTAGIAVLLNNLLALLLLLPALACIRVFVIDREEAYLEAKFGDAYREYKARVPRWF